MISVAVVLSPGPFAFAAESGKNITKVNSDGCAEGTQTSSREAAVFDAKRNAVRIWLETELGTPPGDEFVPLYGSLDRYVASLRVTKVHPAAKQTCASIEAYIDERALRADAATLLFRLRAGPIKVALLTIEEDGTQGSRRFQDQTRSAKLFAKALGTRGLSVVGGANAAAYTEREVISISESGPAALARYGAEQGADAVVAVETRLTAKPQGGGASGMTARAHVVVRTVGTLDGRLHDHSEADAEIDCADAASGHGFALSDAVYKVQERTVVGAILASGRASGQQVRLSIEGVGDFAVAERFAEVLRGTAGVSAANVVSVRGGSALLQFSYAGRMAPLVERLSAGGGGLPKLDVVKVVGGEMLFRALP